METKDCSKYVNDEFPRRDVPIMTPTFRNPDVIHVERTTQPEAPTDQTASSSLDIYDALDQLDAHPKVPERVGGTSSEGGYLSRFTRGVTRYVNDSPLYKRYWHGIPSAGVSGSKREIYSDRELKDAESLYDAFKVPSHRDVPSERGNSVFWMTSEPTDPLWQTFKSIYINSNGSLREEYNLLLPDEIVYSRAYTKNEFTGEYCLLFSVFKSRFEEAQALVSERCGNNPHIHLRLVPDLLRRRSEGMKLRYEFDRPAEYDNVSRDKISV